jgi:hypothetical protein
VCSTAAVSGGFCWQWRLPARVSSGAGGLFWPPSRLGRRGAVVFGAVRLGSGAFLRVLEFCSDFHQGRLGWGVKGFTCDTISVVKRKNRAVGKHARNGTRRRVRGSNGDEKAARTIGCVSGFLVNV